MDISPEGQEKTRSTNETIDGLRAFVRAHREAIAQDKTPQKLSRKERKKLATALNRCLDPETISEETIRLLVEVSDCYESQDYHTILDIARATLRKNFDTLFSIVQETGLNKDDNYALFKNSLHAMVRALGQMPAKKQKQVFGQLKGLFEWDEEETMPWIVEAIGQDGESIVFFYSFEECRDTLLKAAPDWPFAESVFLAGHAFAEDGSTELIEKECAMLLSLGEEPESTRAHWEEHIKEMIRVWRQNAPIYEDPYSMRSIIETNLQCMRHVEFEYPGGVELLHRYYGISCFGRYPPEVLLRQLQHHTDTDTEYGTLIYPLHDWNGSFYNDTAIIGKLDEGLQENNGLVRIFEVSSVLEGYRKLFRLHKAFGEHQKIQFAILGGHGSRYVMDVGHDAEGEITQLLSKHLGVRDHTKVTDFFVHDPTIVLVSCSTARRRSYLDRIRRIKTPSVANAFRDLFGNETRIFASQKPTNLKSLSAERDSSGRLVIEAAFEDPQSTVAIHQNTRTVIS